MNTALDVAKAEGVMAYSKCCKLDTLKCRSTSCLVTSDLLTVVAGRPLGEDGATGRYQRPRAGGGGVLTGEPAEGAGRAEGERAAREDGRRLTGPPTLQQAAPGQTHTAEMVHPGQTSRQRPASNPGAMSLGSFETPIASALHYEAQVNNIGSIACVSLSFSN